MRYSYDKNTDTYYLKEKKKVYKKKDLIDGMMKSYRKRIRQLKKEITDGSKNT